MQAHFIFSQSHNATLKKIKRAFMPPHGDTANFQRQSIKCKSLLQPASELQTVVLRGDSSTTANIRFLCK